MTKFKYKFKAIKEIKKRFEKKAQKDLAVIDLDISNKKNEIIEITNKLKEQKIKKLTDKNKTIAKFHFDEKYESYLVNQIEVLQSYIAKRMVERKVKVEELVQKSKETQTFEKLEETHLSEFIKIENEIEQKEMDEFAVTEFLKD